MIKIRIEPTGKLEEGYLGYRVIREDSRKTIYTIEVAEIDGHYLLMEKRGDSIVSPSKPVGIENKKDIEKVRERILKIARNEARKTIEQLTKELTPTLVDIASH